MYLLCQRLTFNGNNLRLIQSGWTVDNPCAAHVCTLFSSATNLRESYGSQVYQEMQPFREEMWVGSNVTAL
jgi:hypothetical protein